MGNKGNRTSPIWGRYLNPSLFPAKKPERTTINGPIYPPRATNAIPRDQTHLYQRLGWKAQLKYNDTHILLDYRCTPEGAHLHDVYDRHTKHPAYDFNRSPLTKSLHDLGKQLGSSGRTLLDGGLLHSRHTALKDTIVIWDVLIRPTQEHPEGAHLLGSTVQERYDWLRSLITSSPPLGEFVINGEPIGYLLLPRIIVPKFIHAGSNMDEWDKLWEIVERVNKHQSNISGQPILEGLVFKNPHGILKHGLTEKNNSDWISRSRVRTGRHLF